MAATLTDPLLGRLVDGRYEVLSRIARGGMATVYLAVDRRLDREVAIKVMHPHLAEGGAGSEFVARFRREARAAARLTHPGLVGVFDQGVDGETSYLTMEYIEGTNLRRHLGESGSLSLQEAFGTVEAILEALAAAHRVGLVHRDIKPENVLLGSDGRIKVADFGLARAVTEVTATTTGTVLGTVAYLSPELVAHGTSDTRTDVYAVGILLYEMITGVQPFTGATPIQIAYQHVHNDIPAASDVVAWLPLEIDELISALAAREPDERPADASAALALLRRTRAALDEPTLARRADVPPSITLPNTTAGDPDDDELEDTFDDRFEEDDEPRTSIARHAARTTDEPDPDATAAIAVPRPRRGPPPPTPADQERGYGGTIALQIGSGLAPDPEPDVDPERPRRRVLAVVLPLVALLALVGGGLWWFLTAGPGAYTVVPSGLVGAELAAAEGLLADAGLDAAPTEVFDPEVAKGIVVDAAPGEGARILKDGSVDLAVSKGPDLRTVPAGLVGLPAADVTAALEAAGFVVPTPERSFDDLTAADHVLTVSAEGDTQLAVGAEVRLLVSDGPAPLTVISVIGAPRDEAIGQLTDQGLVVAEELTDYSEEYAEGVVMAQNPTPGAAAHRTDPVSITTSQGPPLVLVPDVVGQDLGQATATLVELGFEVDAQKSFFWDTQVVNQDPVAGVAVPKGSTITLTVR
ncbi:Stk1 family PASTA domain-containing Ser/Thr kinase [Cellulomonas sp. KRMCY2]|uniref:Stk1 family PASTA domain-containing Ser/Thr kinase n=1 Tax=Cellulomonas sp. KRMCY2 TaxID=1304865 RepID=UPI00045E98AE|nr:Stk1 family PASTA domain-containing Ser/Thr kinase [Cellulomonas sp. KRMCY2]